MAKYNQDFLDTIDVLGFLLDVMNYEENLKQSDNDDIMNSLDRKSDLLLKKLEADIAVQNAMLDEILAEVKK